MKMCYNKTYMQKGKNIVVANWKMNPATLKEAREIYATVRKAASSMRRTQTVICPPFVYLEALAKLHKGHRVAFGAQDCFWAEKGAHTGEISPAMIKDSGASYVIVGHSERRALGESNEVVNRKIRIALKHNLTVILCIGEKERDTQGLYLSFLQNEISDALQSVTKKKISSLIIAYEPIWAIGKRASFAIMPRDLHEMSIFIKKTLRDIYKSNDVLSVPIIYGGSVDAKNTDGLVREGKVQGLLVGHKSLVPRQFVDILRAVDRIPA
jgi:triosephosphate isomerase